MPNVFPATRPHDGGASSAGASAQVSPLGFSISGWNGTAPGDCAACHAGSHQSSGSLRAPAAPCLVAVPRTTGSG